MKDQKPAISHLQRAIRCKTISHMDRSRMAFAEFERFLTTLKADYPLLFRNAKSQRFQEYSLLLTLKGSTDLKPVGMMGHYDVVPVEPGSWTRDPFDGVIEGDHLYGRGALDMKGHLIALLEAVEDLLSVGFVFERDLHIMLGHNEETGSNVPDSGAVAIRDHLRDRGILFRIVCDEGGAFLDGKALQIQGVLVLVGVAEKGYANVELSYRQKGGHASAPPETSALYHVFQAGIRLEERKFPAHFTPVTDAMFESLIPHMKRPFRFLFKNRNLFKPLLMWHMLKRPEMAATLRTTCIMTQAKGSAAPNVLAQESRVILNVRILPGESIKSVEERIRRVVGDTIHVHTRHGTEPTEISPSNNEEFQMIEEAIRSTYPHVRVVAPYLTIAATDSRIYHGMADGVYRIAPIEIEPIDLLTIHANNERIKISNFLKGIDFFRSLISHATQA